MTAPALRRCGGCGYEFRSLGEVFCSSICAGIPATWALVDLLRRFPVRSAT